MARPVHTGYTHKSAKSRSNKSANAKYNAQVRRATKSGAKLSAGQLVGSGVKLS